MSTEQVKGDQRWHAEVRVDIRLTERQMCVSAPASDEYPALARAKDWLANEMTEDFKRYATERWVRERMLAVADDHAAYDGHGRGWEGWFVTPDPANQLFHYRLTPCGGDCEVVEKETQ